MFTFTWQGTSCGCVYYEFSLLEAKAEATCLCFLFWQSSAVQRKAVVCQHLPLVKLWLRLGKKMSWLDTGSAQLCPMSKPPVRDCYLGLHFAWLSCSTCHGNLCKTVKVCIDQPGFTGISAYKKGHHLLHTLLHSRVLTVPDHIPKVEYTLFKFSFEDCIWLQFNNLTFHWSMFRKEASDDWGQSSYRNPEWVLSEMKNLPHHNSFSFTKTGSSLPLLERNMRIWGKIVKNLFSAMPWGNQHTALCVLKSPHSVTHSCNSSQNWWWIWALVRMKLTICTTGWIIVLRSFFLRFARSTFGWIMQRNTIGVFLPLPQQPDKSFHFPTHIRCTCGAHRYKFWPDKVVVIEKALKCI